jgi:hypothetical protein
LAQKIAYKPIEGLICAITDVIVIAAKKRNAKIAGVHSRAFTGGDAKCQWEWCMC